MKVEVPNIDLMTVETGIPLVEGKAAVRVEKMEVVRNKANDGDILKIQLKTLEDLTSTKGEAVSAGFVIFDQVALKTTESYNPGRRLAAIMECFDQRRADFDTENLIGREGIVKLATRVDKSGQYGDQTEVKYYEKAK